MKDYFEFAERNGVTLLDDGPCQFCGAQTKRGIHECLEIFNLGFRLDFSNPENHIYRFQMVDAHALQHPEIHGRWSNHFHLTRLHLIIKYDVQWTYKLSPILSNHLNEYKVKKKNEYLNPQNPFERGAVNSTEILKGLSQEQRKELIKRWAFEVYHKWSPYHHVVDKLAVDFLRNM